jgi:hypothetical protein
MRHAARVNPHVLVWTNPDTGQTEVNRYDSRPEGETALATYARRYPWNTYGLFEMVGEVASTAERPAIDASPAREA